MMKRFFVPILFLLSFSCCKVKQVNLENLDSGTTDFNVLSERLLHNLRNGEETKSITAELALTTIEELDIALTTDAQRYAFWVNIYNAYILLVLTENPDLYNNRGRFFSKKQLNIAGQMISFETIEHGILRKSQWSKGLGYIRKWFPNKFERKLRVDKRDFRIHFALNCGAKDCPPVAIYTPEGLHEQFEKATKMYLESSTSYEEKSNTAKVTPLFSWFRGDFGGKRGVKKILKRYGQLETVEDVGLRFKNYDWNLDLDNFIEL